MSVVIHFNHLQLNNSFHDVYNYISYHSSLKDLVFVTFRSFNLEGTALVEFKEGVVQEHGNDVHVEGPMCCF